MSAPNGTGRGGRGAALLRIIQSQQRPGEAAAIAAASSTLEPSRPPGPSETLTPVVPTTSAVLAPVPSMPSSTAMPPPQQPLSLGRGSLLARLPLIKKVDTPPPPSSLAQSTSVSYSVSETSSGSVTPSRGFSRGLPSSSATTPTPSFSSTSSMPLTRQLERLQIDFPPKERGKDGMPIPLVVNHIPIRLREGKGIFEYAVMYKPQMDSVQFRFKLLNQQLEVIGRVKNFDGAKLFLPHRLENTMTILQGEHPVDGSAVEITIKFIREQQLTDCIHHFNILFCRVMAAMDLVKIGRHTFDPKGSVSISRHKLELWPGYITAIQDFDGGLMLLAEVSHRALRTQTVLEYMSDIHQSGRGNFRDDCQKALIGCVVLTRYNNKTYRIDDIMWDQNPKNTFTSAAGREITYCDYYKTSYNIDLRDLQQPLLLHREKTKLRNDKFRGEEKTKMLCIIPELCYLTGLSDDMRSDFFIMKDIGAHTRVSPNQRQFTLTKFVRNIYDCPKAKEILDSWGIEILPTFTPVEGRIFKNENIIFGNNVRASSGKQADWSREQGNNRVLRAVDFDNWIIIFTRRNQTAVQNFAAMVNQVAPQLGIRINRPQMFMMPDDRNDTLMRYLRENIRSEVQIVVVVNPTSRDDRYSLIKKICCADFPVPSQVINGKTIDAHQKLRSVTQKIVLQMNCKLGGELWAIEVPLKKLMVVGMDVFHDTTSAKNSVLGFVFSVNETLTRWSNQSVFQNASCQELGSSLRMCFAFALKKYHEVNHYLPEKIIVFRDGVGDGQLEQVSTYEVEQFMASFLSFGPEYKPSLTVIVVQKRINTRIFLAMDARNLDNPPPGTVLDHTATRKNWYDFFLVSQHVRQGTVTPTHYVVVHNSNANLKPDHIQRLTYKMTHLYYNWPGTVRVPAPCQYAHRLAAQVGQAIHKQPSSKLEDRLFFL